MKRLAKILLALAAVLLLIWVLGRYGWRLGGFRACGGSGIDFVSVSDTQVEIRGFYPGSFPEGCVGYIWAQEGDALYLGVRYDGLFGFFEQGQFDAVIPVDRKINTVYLKTANHVYEIWNREGNAPCDTTKP